LFSSLIMNFHTLILVFLSILFISSAVETVDGNRLFVKRSPNSHESVSPLARGGRGDSGRGDSGRGGSGGGRGGRTYAAATTTTARERVPGF
ncbi:hypothetical protein PRIPAC_96340, partial [Pristionchus pacificus]